jgi:hypothetical protein
MGIKPNRFQQGQHICVLFNTAEEQIAIAAAYIADGLERGEQCLYAGNSAAALKRFRLALQEHGIDAERAQKRGALITRLDSDVHVAGGSFDSERMLHVLNESLESALNAGYQGLRTCGDMSWLLTNPPGADQVVEYEALLNEFFRGARALGMCLYDRKRLSAAAVDHGIATHSTVVINREHKHNPFYELPALAAKRSPQAAAVSGKIAGLQRLS